MRPGLLTIWKWRQISVVYICLDLKKTTNNLLRILSHILSFMLLQNKYKKCDYCFLLLSSFCVVCVFFLILSFPFWMTLSFKRVRRRGARLAHNKHYTQGWCALYSCLVLSRLLLSCLVFACFLSARVVLSCLLLSCLVVSSLLLFCVLLSCIVLSCLVLSCLLLSCLVLSFIDLKSSYLPQAVFPHRPHLGSVSSSIRSNT